MNRGDRVALAVVSFLSVFIFGSLAIGMGSAGWFQNLEKVEYRVHQVTSPSPYPSASPVIEYVEVEVTKPAQTVTKIVEVPVQGGGSSGITEGCIEALRAADALAKAVINGNATTAEAINYQAYRSVCKV